MSHRMTMHATRQATQQYASLPPAAAKAVDHTMEQVESADDVRRTGTELSDSPAGRLFRLRARNVRVLVAVDEADEVTVMGYGSRPDGQPGPRQQLRFPGDEHDTDAED